MSYLPFVDGLRAVAIISVVGFHAFPSVVPGGFAGVDVFFVISGFLITRLIAHEIAAGAFSLRRFFVRRARRLLPASLVCFAVVTGLAAIVLLPDAFHYYGRSMLAAVLMYANIFFYRTGGYFSAPSLEKPLLHTWSLAVEDQFYLTWPLIVMLCARFSPRLTAPIAALIALASLALAQRMALQNPDFAFYVLPTRACELLTGAGLAMLAQGQISLPRAFAEGLSLLGLASIVASFALLSPNTTFPGLAAVPACLGTAAVVAAGLSRATLLTNALATAPAVLLGKISYSLYLWHWPLIALLSYRLERPLLPSEAAAVAGLSLALAYLSWHFVERPFRMREDHLAGYAWPPADRRFVAGALAGVLAIAGLAGAIKILKGAPQRYSAEARHILDQMVAGNPNRRACDNYDRIFANDAICNFGRKKAQSQSYEVAIFGDSMADQWVPLAAAFAAKNSLAGRQVTNGGCAFFIGIPIPATPASKAIECTHYQEQAQKFVAANPELKLAVISGFWEKWLARIERNEAPGAPMTDAPFAPLDAPRFDAVMRGTIAYFTSRGIKVLLIGQIPTYALLPVRCIIKAASTGSDPGKCGKSAEAAALELKASSAALARAAARNPDVSLFLPEARMCTKDICPPVLDGVMLYKNNGHINSYGAAYLARFATFPALATAPGAAPP